MISTFATGTDGNVLAKRKPIMMSCKSGWVLKRSAQRRLCEAISNRELLLKIIQEQAEAAPKKPVVAVIDQFEEASAEQEAIATTFDLRQSANS